MSIKITYAITVCNELEVEAVIEQLIETTDFNSGEYELLIQFDSDKVTDAVLNLITKYSSEFDYCKVIGFALNGDFAAFKNNLIENANGEYIFQIDADETLSDQLSDPRILYSILQTNPTVELFNVPRINIVAGITQEYITEMGWNSVYRGFIAEDALNEKTINFPDYQSRIFKRSSNIKWYGKIHERILGHKTETFLPATEDFSIEHVKSFERQVAQNTLYSELIK